jgi:cobalamin biosynthesis protein CobW
MHKIPVTVITGFLGSGKTTLIRHLLQNNQGRRIAVLVNEFGEIGIDGELLRDCQICDEGDNPASNIVELTNGCLCCTVQEEFYPVMQQLLAQRDRLDCILVETSGLALPKPLVQAFRWEEIRHRATVDGVITVVDGQALAAGQWVADLDAIAAQRKSDDSLDHETPLEELFEDQLACCDLVLLTKTDCLNEADRDRVETWLRSELRPEVKIIPCDRGQVAADILLGFNAAVEDCLHNRPSHHDHEEDHEHDDNIQSFEWIAPALVVEPLLKTLKSLVKTHEIYRIKGFVAVPRKPMRLVLQGVGDRFETYYDRAWRSDETPSTRLVVIGRSLDLLALQAALQSTELAPFPSS